ncbi:condensation domain-containing protein [Streptomyces sp. NPDC012421]|uniref:condensation domain-containing protein n=1 Tax=Streptomyces sp. NPDC012421 TaxID=3364832 RepID=UPI0036EC740C
MSTPPSPVRTLPLLVSGARSGTAPLTWSQRLQWNDTEWMKPHDHHFNHVKVLDLPEGVTEAAVADAVATVAGRHEALRTRYRTDRDGTPVQVLEATVSLPLEVHRTPGPEADPAAEAARLAEAKRGTRFDLATELPLRVALLEHGGRPDRLVVVASHVTLDHAGLVLLSQELDALLQGRTTPAELAPVTHQHLDQERAEASPRGRARSEAALAHWEEVLRAAPATLFDPPAGDPPPLDHPDRFGQVTLVSPALALATGTLAVRLGTSSTTVLMAALHSVLGTLTGRPGVPLRLIASNRGLPELRELVGIAFGSCVTLVRTAGEDFPDVVRATGSAAMRAYRRAQCDPVALTALKARVGAERGVPEVELTCGFNDMRPPRTEAAATAGEIRALLPRTETAWDGPRPRQEARLWYWAQDADGADVHHALVDLWYLPRERTRDLLLEVERLVVDAAVRGLPDDAP